jgi:hypothetical protein
MNTKSCLLPVFAMGFLAGPLAVHADYNYQLINHPGAPQTQIFGVNDAGVAVGVGIDITGSLPFAYDSKTGAFTDIAPASGFADTAVLGITDSGVMVGTVQSMDGLTSDGFIRDKSGADTFFSHPDALSATHARSANNKGLVSGYRDSPTGMLESFIYDPKTNSFTDIVPSLQTIAHGMNSMGDVVGSAIFFPEDDPCPEITSGFPTRYGWLRTSDGSVSYFRVNGFNTRARGINDARAIVGWFYDAAADKDRGFVVTLEGLPCESVSIADSDLLDFPGGDGTIPEGITNSGIIVGIIDTYYPTWIQQGFIAEPR